MLPPQILHYIFLVMNAWIMALPCSFYGRLYFHIKDIISVSIQTVSCTTSEINHLNPRILTCIHPGKHTSNLQVAYLISCELSISINIKHIVIISFTRSRTKSINMFYTVN